MAKSEVPGYHFFNTNGAHKKERALRVTLGPQVAVVQVTIWPVDGEGEPTEIGNTQSISMNRGELIGLAYEILQAAGAE